MGYNELETDLRKILSQIGRWREIGYMPTIEQGIALGKLQEIYSDLLDLPCGEPEPGERFMTSIEIRNVTEDTDIAIDAKSSDNQTPVTETGYGEFDLPDNQTPVTETGYGEFDLPDDESFEPCCDPDIETTGSKPTEKADDDGNFADLSAEECHRKSGETFLKQEYGAKDLCPPPLEFPEENNTVDNPDQADAKETSTGEPSTETHMMQEFGTHDIYPPQTEVPEIEATADPETEVPEIEATADSEIEAPEIEATADSEIEEPATEPEKEKKMDVFGIEVSPYARHEIVDTLFHGNTKLFDAECTKISAMDDLEEALVYIGETYNWIPENAATIKFIDLLETRFSE